MIQVDQDDIDLQGEKDHRSHIKSRTSRVRGWTRPLRGKTSKEKASKAGKKKRFIS